MVKVCESLGVDYQWYQVAEADRALKTMAMFDIPTTDPAYQALWRQRGAILSRIGRKVSRDSVLLAWSFGFSPGIIKVWHEAELGWMSEARTKPGAPPIYKAVSDEVAMAIIKKEVTPQLEKELMTPDDYLGE